MYLKTNNQVSTPIIIFRNQIWIKFLFAKVIKNINTSLFYNKLFVFKKPYDIKSFSLLYDVFQYTLLNYELIKSEIKLLTYKKKVKILMNNYLN